MLLKEKSEIDRKLRDNFLTLKLIQSMKQNKDNKIGKKIAKTQHLTNRWIHTPVGRNSLTSDWFALHITKN